MMRFPVFNKGSNKALENKAEGSKSKTVLAGALSGIAVMLTAAAVFSVIMLIAGIDRIYAPVFATLSVSAGAFVSALVVARRSKIKGVLAGALTGLCYFLSITLISLAVDNSGLSFNTLFHFLIIVISSAIGGITGANKKQSGGKIRL